MSEFFYGILNIILPATFLQELTIHDHESLLQAENFCQEPGRCCKPLEITVSTGV